jgi:predicted CXXCH cytochrome family protein
MKSLYINRWNLLALLSVLALYQFMACDVRDVVEVERPLFTQPPANAGGFLGYDEQADKKTVCGNCHVDTQSTWETTAHADAWESLQASGHAAAFCENCHTVGPNGTDGEGGWATTSDERYHDVQCESCHGPSAAHVANPEVSQPIASIDIGDLSNLANAKNCAECHQGTHHPFAEEWAQSKHAEVVSFAAGREACAGCHRGQGALDAWGVTSRYTERDSPDHLAITCAVCHDPHDGTNIGQLRRPVVTTSVERNLCASCHNRRTVPDPNSSHGLEPHAPETALLLGDAGWFPPGANINQGQIVATHGSDANNALCATCHVNRFEVTDAATGEFVFQATGHLFTSIPCLDEDGKPTPGDCVVSAAARSFDACATSGCHVSPEGAAASLVSKAADIQGWADELFGLLEQVDPNGEDAGGEIDPADPTFTVAEGALFNYHLAEFGDDVLGSTTHNPFLIEALLVGSINAVQNEYGVSGPHTSIELEATLATLVESAPVVTPIPRTANMYNDTPIPSTIPMGRK